MNRFNPSYNGISTVIPAYNSQDTLKELTQRLIKVLGETNYPFEIIFINDGSSDDSWEIIAQLAQNDPRIVGIDLTKNFGQINATLCGMNHARYDLVLTMDDDLQHLPEETPKLLKMMETGKYDVVYGIYHEKQDSWLRKAGSRFHDFLYCRILGKPTDIRLGSFRMFGPTCVEAIKKFRTPRPLLHPIVLTITNKLGNVTVRHEPRKSGKSGYTLRKMIAFTFDIIFYYSLIPIRFIVNFGLAIMLFSFLSSLFVFIQALHEKPAQLGWASLWVLISFSCGSIIVLLGGIGEYIKRFIDEVSQKPQYVVHYKTEKNT